MKIVDSLKRVNRTLLEMYAGILFWGVVCQIVGAFLVSDLGGYSRALWFGILFAMVNTLHMYRSLDRALDFDEKTATKMIYSAYLIRYVSVAVVLFIAAITELMNPLVVFMAYMGLKVTVYLQPITHKLSNKLFHETDPIPEALPEEEKEQISIE